MAKQRGLRGEAYWNDRIERYSQAISWAMERGKRELAERLYAARTNAQEQRAWALREQYGR